MKRRYLIFISLILLQACQQKQEITETTLSGKGYNRNEAAALNVQLGLAYLKKDDRPRAKRKLLTALSQAPDAANVNAAMAYFLEKTGVLNEADAYYKKALSQAPEAGAQLNNYGAFLCRQGQYQQSLTYFLKAARDVHYERNAGAYENAGLCALAIPDYPKATQFFAKALEHDPSRKQSLLELIKAELKQEHTAQALDYLQKHPELALTDRRLLTLAADVAHQAGKTELEANYRLRLHQLSSFSHTTGVNHEYNSNSG